MQKNSDHVNTLRFTLTRSTVFSVPKLVCDSINADSCVQGAIFQRFSIFTFSSFAPFQISVIFQDLGTIFAKFHAIFADFHRSQQILEFLVKI